MNESKTPKQNRLLGTTTRQKSTNPKIEILYQRLEKLEEVFNSKTSYTSEYVIRWVAECVALFTELHLSTEIIQGFMKTFEHDPPVENPYSFMDRGQKDDKIGPFKKGTHIHGGEYSLDSGNSFSLERFKKNSSRIYYVHIAFTSAHHAIQKIEEGDALVPKHLLTFFIDKKDYSNIASSLSLLEKAYQEKNSDGLVKNSVTLLENILDLEPALKKKDKISLKLRALLTDKALSDKFGVEKEFIFALDNNRLIRNHKSAHKNKPIKYDIPLLVSLGVAYLVLIFLEIAISRDELIK